MSEWHQTTVGDVITLQRGFDITRAKQRPGKIPVVSSGGIGSYHDTPMASGPGVVIGRKGTLGKVFYLASEYWPHDTTLWVKDFKGNNPKFVYYFLMTLNFLAMDVGSSNPTLNRNHVHPKRIFWTSRSNQDAIADALGALDDKIAVNECIVHTLNELSSAIFLSTEPKILTPLSNVSQIIMGQSPPGDTYNETMEGIPFYQGTKDFGFRFPGKRVWCTTVTRRAADKDVLVSVRAPVGTINVATEECGIGRGLAAVRSSTHPHTLLQALSANKTIWTPYEKEGTVFGSINKKQFNELDIPWPEGHLLDETEQRLQSLDDLLSRHTSESRTLAELRDTLLPQLMSGKLRVKDAEKIVEDNV